MYFREKKEKIWSERELLGREQQRKESRSEKREKSIKEQEVVEGNIGGRERVGIER